MQAQKAVLRGYKLYQDQFVYAVKNPAPKRKRARADPSTITGWVLTHEDDDFFEERLRDYDAIQGFNKKSPLNGFYARDIV